MPYDSPEPQPSKHEFWRIMEVEADHVSRPGPLLEKKRRILACLLVRFPECVTAFAGPDGAVIGIQRNGVLELIEAR